MGYLLLLLLKDPAPRCHCWNQGFGLLQEQRERVLMMAKCCLSLSGGCRGCHNVSVSHVSPRGHGKWDINKAKVNAEPLTYLQMFLLGLFVSVIPQSTLGEADLLLLGISYPCPFSEMGLLFHSGGFCG